MKVESVSHMPLQKCMRRTEEGFAFLRWGRGITVRRPSETLGTEYVEIEAEEVYEDEIMPISALDAVRRNLNLLPQLSSKVANWGNPDRRTADLHIRFANARTDEELFAFLREFGPVLGTVDRSEDGQCEEKMRSVCEESTEGSTAALASGRRMKPGPVSARVLEHLPSLREERERFAALMSLVGLLKEPVFDREAVLRAAHHVDRLFRRAAVSIDPTALLRLVIQTRTHGRKESQRRAEATSSGGTEESVPWEDLLAHRKAGDVSDAWLEQLILSDLVSSLGGYRVRPVVVSMGRRARPQIVVLPDREGRALRGVLYGQLARELEGPGGVRRCPNLKCQKHFKPERVNQRFCSKGCAGRAASAKYYEKHGRTRRQVRRNASERGPGAGRRR